MKRFLFLIAILCLAVTFTRAEAQPVLEFDAVQVDVWPEYDRTDVLVIYKMTISAQTSLPAQVSLRIPKEVGQPYNVAMQDVDGLLYNVGYTTSIDGDWLRINFTAPTISLQMEYYDPRMTRTNSDRKFEYRWAGDYKVKNMVFRVQTPVSASQMQITPTLGTPSQEQDGLTYFTNQVGPVDAGTPFTFRINYTKPDDKLSAVQQAVQPQGGVAASTSGQSTAAGAVAGISPIMIGGIAGGVLILLGLIWYLRQRQLEQAPQSSRRHTRSSTTPEFAKKHPPQQSGSETTIYCQQCGKRAAPGDAFCRSCGTKLRLE
jgi:hypothetical protein